MKTETDHAALTAAYYRGMLTAYELLLERVQKHLTALAGSEAEVQQRISAAGVCLEDAITELRHAIEV